MILTLAVVWVEAERIGVALSKRLSAGEDETAVRKITKSPVLSDSAGSHCPNHVRAGHHVLSERGSTDTGCARYTALHQVHHCPGPGRAPAEAAPEAGRPSPHWWTWPAPLPAPAVTPGGGSPAPRQAGADAPGTPA